MDKKGLKILVIGMTDGKGGIENFFLNAARAAAENSSIKYDFTDTYGLIAFEDELKKLGADIYKIPYFKKHPLKYFFAMIKLIKQNKYNIVHCNMLSCANILPLIAAKAAGANVIAHSHNNGADGAFKNFLHRFNKPFIPFLADIYLSCSAQAAAWLYPASRAVKAVIINNGIDVKKFAYNPSVRQTERARLGAQVKTVIGLTGRMTEAKNHLFLIDIFEFFLKKDKNALLLFVGAGHMEERLRAKVRALGLENAVIFYGDTNDTAPLYQAMDLFIMPSLYEGFGIAALEAQASGLPCLLSDKIPAQAAIVNTRQTALNAGAQLWANSALEILENFKRKDESCVIERAGFSINATARQLEDIYRQTLKQDVRS